MSNRGIGRAMATDTAVTRAPDSETDAPYWPAVALWSVAGLAAVLLATAVLYLYGLDREGYGNTYYAAAVKSMLTSWRNFFFASFDSGGFVTVDKPPVGLWVQVASARLFGFSGWALLLPQAIAGIASVALVFFLVRRAFGDLAGLVAAAALAVTPISVVVSRNNTMDSLLVLALLIAAWAVLRAAERGRLSSLLLCAAVVGVGFNIKMLQAWLVVPGFWLVYLLGAPLSWRRRVVHLALASAVLLLVSLAWVAAVDLTPADQRPFIGSSSTNSALNLALAYNGLGRLARALSSDLGTVRLFHVTLDLRQAPAFAPQIGNPGLLRLFSDGLAGQATWFLPLALIAPVAAWRRRPRFPLARRDLTLLLWGTWLAVWAAYFSIARFYHLYYLTMLGPPVAALAGIALSESWRQYRLGLARGLLLPLAVVATIAVQTRILAAYPEWSAKFSPWLQAVGAVAAALFVICWLWKRCSSALPAVAMATGVLALLAPPAVWSVISVQNGNGAAWLPEAGPPRSFAAPASRGAPASVGAARPATGRGLARPPGIRGGPGPTSGPQGPGLRPGGAFAGGGGQGALTIAGPNWNVLDPKLLQYLLDHQGGARYLVATTTSTYASIFMLATDQPAMALGGYQGWDRIVTPQQLAELVRNRAVRFFYLSGNRGAGGAEGLDATADLVDWVRQACVTVPAAYWQSTPPEPAGAFAFGGNRGGGLQLCDCQPVATAAHP